MSGHVNMISDDRSSQYEDVVTVDVTMITNRCILIYDQAFIYLTLQNQNCF